MVERTWPRGLAACAFVAVVVWQQVWWLLELAPLPAYALAFLGHVFAHNRPNTFEHPAWAFFAYWRSRVVWLVVLFLGGFLTATVMERFQADLRGARPLACTGLRISSRRPSRRRKAASLRAVGRVASFRHRRLDP